MKEFKSSLIGKVYTNTQGHSVTVIEIFPDEDGYYSNARALVRFSSGYVGEYGIKSLRKGYFKDYGTPNKVGGYDYPKNSKTDRNIYHRWYDMLDRCNNPDNQDYHNYGGRGVYVCERWHYLENFEKDIIELKNYEKMVRNPKKYTLDKDILFKDNMVYSKDTCMFANDEDQSQNRRSVIPVKCIDEEGNEQIFKSMAHASRTLNINKALIRRVVNGVASHTHGYYFERI